VKSDLPERTFEFAKQIVRLCRQLDGSPGAPRTLANQLLRSGTSIGANVEEGQAGQSEADFVSKYSIACKEARETHYWLRLILASDLLDAARLKPQIDECNELIAILTSIIIKMRAKNPPKTAGSVK
jgi:four helix bundle protein